MRLDDISDVDHNTNRYNGMVILARITYDNTFTTFSPANTMR